MVAFQVAKRGVTDARVLEAMRQVPREAFVGAGMEEFAYEDAPLPTAAGQTISQPYIVALMIAAAQIKPGDRVLDVGTGSGYAAGVLSRLAGKVFSVERHRSRARIVQASCLEQRRRKYRQKEWVPDLRSRKLPELATPVDQLDAPFSLAQLRESPTLEDLRLGLSVGHANLVTQFDTGPEFPFHFGTFSDQRLFPAAIPLRTRPDNKLG